MDRFIGITKVLKTRFTNWWTARVERPGCEFSDVHMQRKDAVLMWVFCRNPFGRAFYNGMSANDWTWLRLYYSWIPMMYLIKGEVLTACVCFIGIELTDMFDGWFARMKGQVTEWGAWFETRVDWVLLVQTLVGVHVRYHDMQWSTVTVGLLELLRAAGGICLNAAGFKPLPNRAGRWKMPFLVGGIGFRLINDLVTDPTTTSYAIAILLCAYTCMVIGIVLSIVSLHEHLRDFRAWMPQTRR